MRLAYTTADRNPIVEAFLNDSCGGSAGLCLDIPTADNMYGFLAQAAGGHREAALLAYFRSGWSAYRTVRALLDAPGGPGAAARILDFAGGYGRSTRYLVRDHNPALVTVCDILPDAVAFQHDRFGVQAALSATTPEELALDGSYDLIFVASLFSHLPERSFGRWLARLLDLLAPGGVLAFSTHDTTLMLAGRSMPEDGIYFEGQSDLVGRLEEADYGTSWVTEDFVRRVLGRVAGPQRAATARRVPRGLWSFQDLWLVGGTSCPDSYLQSVDPPIEAQAVVEEVRREDSSTFDIAGWAVDLVGPRPVAQIDILVDGAVVASATPTDPRRDVATFLGLGEPIRAGFRLTVTLEHPLDPRALLALAVTTEAGVRHLALCDTLASAALGWAREQDQAVARAHKEGFEARIHDLEFVLQGREYELAVARNTCSTRDREIAAMQASAFWRLRDAWWALRRGLGLGRA